VFIPIAEESGLILQIGDWVLRTACTEAASWHAPLSIAVNVSGVQVLAPSFAHDIHEMLVQLPACRRSGWRSKSPRRRWSATCRGRLRRCAMVRALGVNIAMDDFGTGYSSLANLRAFPFSKIKVDQSFIKSVDRNTSRRRSCGPCSVSAAGSTFRSWPKASSVRRNSSSSGEVCKGGAGLSDQPPATIRVRRSQRAASPAASTSSQGKNCSRPADGRR
jgi:hypothetical protein